MTVSREGLLSPLPFPLLISLTITVPEAVPSLFHNSLPLVPSSAEKKRVVPTAEISVGSLPLLPL